MATGKFHGGVTTVSFDGHERGAVDVFQLQAALGVVVGEVDGLGDLGVALVQGLAAFGAHDLQQVGAVGLEGGAGAVQDRGARGGAHAPARTRTPQRRSRTTGVQLVLGVGSWRLGHGVDAQGRSRPSCSAMSRPQARLPGRSGSVSGVFSKSSVPSARPASLASMARGPRRCGPGCGAVREPCRPGRPGRRGSGASRARTGPRSRSSSKTADMKFSWLAPSSRRRIR